MDDSAIYHPVKIKAQPPKTLDPDKLWNDPVLVSFPPEADRRLQTKRVRVILHTKAGEGESKHFMFSETSRFQKQMSRGATQSWVATFNMPTLKMSNLVAGASHNLGDLAKTFPQGSTCRLEIQIADKDHHNFVQLATYLSVFTPENYRQTEHYYREHGSVFVMGSNLFTIDWETQASDQPGMHPQAFREGGQAQGGGV